VIREQWDGNEWQEHCRRLLALKHGVEMSMAMLRSPLVAN
jgi:hypothetical protein